jgi:hypothetical protein
MKRMGIVWAFLFLVWPVMSWAMPTQTQVYENHDLGIKVYKDNTDPNLYWFVPQFIRFEKKPDGSLKYLRRVRSDGTVAYKFWLEVYIPDNAPEVVAKEILNLQNGQQLRPIPATKFAIQIKPYNIFIASDDVTDVDYFKRQQLLRFTLSKDDADDFDELLATKPGVPVSILMFYQAETNDKYLKIDLSYREVYDAMNIGATGRYTFTKAEISANLTNYISNKKLVVRSKGDPKIPEIVDKLIAACFSPVQPPKRSSIAPSLGGSTYSSYLERSDTEEWLRQVAEDAPSCDQDSLTFIESNADAPDNSSDDSDNKKSPSSGAVDKDLQFTFKKELLDRNDTLSFSIEQNIDFAGKVLISSMLSDHPDADPKVTITPVDQRGVTVAFDARADFAARTGAMVQKGDQWTLTASFTLSALSPYGDGRLQYYRWDATWPKVDEDLYYRVGTGPWISVNGRALIGSDSLQTGEIQFYLDREAIWNKIPSSYRDPGTPLGWPPAIFPFNKTFPEFHVKLSGRHVEIH